jgi:hypothetical protein
VSVRRPPRAGAIAAAVGLALILAAAAALAGCGGVQAADLFLVTREGPAPGQRLVMLVNEEGGVTCNGHFAGRLDDSQIVESRAIQEDLKQPASEHMRLAPAPGSVLRYHVRTADGTVEFSDDSAHQPSVFHKLQLVVLRAAQQICHLPE